MMHHFEDEFCEIWETIISPNHHFCEFRVPCFLENHHFSFRLRKPSFWWEVWVARNEAGLRRFPARLRLQNQTTFWNFKQHFSFQIISNFTSFWAASRRGKPSFSVRRPRQAENHHFRESSFLRIWSTPPKSTKTIIFANRKKPSFVQIGTVV